MPRFTDALRGFTFPVHKLDNFKCRYCSLDGLHPSQLVVPFLGFSFQGVIWIETILSTS
jgi:hypothetical protein